LIAEELAETAKKLERYKERAVWLLVIFIFALVIWAALAFHPGAKPQLHGVLVGVNPCAHLPRRTGRLTLAAIHH
jgi:hypothetical protein